MKKWKIICICLTALLFCVSCSNDEPDSLAPDITLNEATAITSTSASLKASVSQNGGKIGTCIFFVATDSLFLNNMKQFPVTLTSNMASVVVESLSPNVTYFYKFQVSSGYSLAVSKVKTFTTLAGPVVPSAPDIVLKDAGSITFSSANLSAYVHANSDKIVSCSFMISTNSSFNADVKEFAVTLADDSVKTTATPLTAATTYYYKLQVTCEKAVVSSDIKSFTTAAKPSSAIEYFNLVSQDGNQAVLKMKLASGISNWTSIGIKYQSEYDASAITQNQTVNAEGIYQLTIKGLHPMSTYTVTAFAASSSLSGETSMTVKTDNKVNLDAAGTLPDVIADKQKYTITTLKIAGPINGTDIGFIHEMGGVLNSGANVATSGKLQTLDLTDARIEAGGNGVNHWGELWTNDENNTLSRRFLDGTTSIKTIIIPSSVTKIVGGGLNADCSVESIETPADNPYFTSVDGVLFDKNKTKLIAFPPLKTLASYAIPDGVTSLESLSFWGVSNVKTLTLPSTLKTLYAEVFCDYQNMSSEFGEIDIPASVTHMEPQMFFGAQVKFAKVYAQISTLPFGTFQYCNKMESVTLGSSITIIDEMAFEQCTLLTGVHCLSSTPPSVVSTSDSPAFKGVDKTACTIYVPKGSLSAYKAASVWSSFTKIVEE